MPRRLAWVAAALSIASSAHAADILFVADADADTEIVAVLMGDGHRVTSVTADYAGGRNTRLAMSLDDFDVVVWSAHGMGTGGVHDEATLFANLDSFVRGGGRIFVTGYDAVASPFDPMLVTFVGATNARDTPGAPGPVADVENPLTVGYEDLRGVTPPTPGNTDCVTDLAPDTVSVVASASDEECHQWTLRTLGLGEIAFVSGSGAAGMWTSGPYNIAVRNFAGSADTSASEPGAPAIELEGPVSADEGAAIELDVAIVDAEGDPFTYSWDTDGDGAFGDRPGQPAYSVGAGLTDGPGAVRVGVEAIDRAGHRATVHRVVRVMNLPPRIRSRAPRAATAGETFSYRLLASDPAGEDDPLAYSLFTGPDGMSVSSAGIVTWMPGTLDLTPDGEPGPTVEVVVEDDDGGTTSQRFELPVTTNHVPTDPMPTYPIDRIAILDTMPRLVATTSFDGDFDPLTYFFEIDTADDFDSAALQASGPIEESPGFAFWYVTSALEPDRLYHWRVWASDGRIESQTQEAQFYVVGDPAEVDAGTDASVSEDGGLAPADGGSMVTPAGCGCRSATGGPSALWTLLLLPTLRRRAR